MYSSSGTAGESLSPSFRTSGRDVNGRVRPVNESAGDLCLPDSGAVRRCGNGGPAVCRRRRLPLTATRRDEDGQTLGLTGGVGGSPHRALQLIRHPYPDTAASVFARDPEARSFALDLGAVWADDTTQRSPAPLYAIYRHHTRLEARGRGPGQPEARRPPGDQAPFARWTGTRTI
jgi:propanol-preferring alcohol dehydrogenase